MKFLHTSDWHLGRQFHHVSLLEDQASLLAQLIDYIKNHSVDAVIIAGDIFDRSVPPTKAIELLNKTLNTICEELKTPVILIPGNHDSAARLNFGAKQMKASGLHIVSSFDQMVEPITIETKQAGLVSFYGMPYSDPESVKHHFQQPVSTHDEAHQLLADKIKDCFISEHKNVLVSHCFVDGAIESDSERPLSIGGSDRVSHEHFVDFDYVALGHLHQPQKKGAEYIRYSGSLMKYSFSEQHHKKGMTLVEFDKDGFKTSEHIDLKPRHDMRVIEGNMDEILQAAKSDPNNEDYVLVRLMDKHAILEPMEKFRTVYPNILHLEKPGMLVGVEQELGAASLKRSEIDMFEDFFQEAQKSSLNEAQKEVIEQVIQQLTCQSES
ncbi:exonuclease SbcCD subunit D [Vibrio marisflavi]|uniref:Nuclease SbcCD subunit D n=1 Tax=Vibrio marisflavi CECT 7928 TaxID=634439 RepID=A0ABM9A0S4_9VIBR|nr:exonuclease SbcCD subunit D [Vibrio marisflavi]CAH0536539.1 Nuclease SbcCD subunit D [Vibrio marisflavi CECT 7928]